MTLDQIALVEKELGRIAEALEVLAPACTFNEPERLVSYGVIWQSIGEIFKVLKEEKSFYVLDEDEEVQDALE